MNTSRIIFLILASFAIRFSLLAQSRKLPIDYVNHFIGTGNNGNCYPGAQAPFGMISISPNTVFSNYKETEARPGYKYNKDEIYGFGMNHYSGVGCLAMQDLQFLPVTGELNVSPVNKKGAYKSHFSHQSEMASPGFYSVALTDYGIETKFTTSIRSAMGEIQYPAGKSASIVFQPTNGANGIGDGSLTIDAKRKRVTGWISTGGFCWGNPKDRPYKVFFVADFNVPVSGFGVWKGDRKIEDMSTISGDDIGGYVTFGIENGGKVQMRTAISHVSVYNAVMNLEEEIHDWNFEKTWFETRNNWSQFLNKIMVNGGTEDEKAGFYTAIYHNLLQPNIVNDFNGEYLGFDDAVHVVEKGRNQFANFSLWDTYRTSAQLQAILAPEHASDMAQSLYLDAVQGGSYPNWSMNNVEYGVMNGYSPFPFVAGLYAFGATHFDLSEAKDLMKKVSMDFYSCKGYHGWYNIEDYKKLGYVPVDKHGYGASMTIEYGIDDYAIAKICKAAHDEDAAAYYLKRSQNVFNLYDPESKLLRGRNVDGKFMIPFDSVTEKGFNEGCATQYFWSVPYSISKLIALAGGKMAVEKRLDRFNSQIKTGWAPDQPYNWVGNEPCFGTVYVYNFLQVPWKAQFHARRIARMFNNSPDGLPGDDDVGAMSALYAFNVLGLYPYIPGEGGFTVTGPLFENVVLKLENGKMIIMNAKGAKTNAPYIQSMKVNGKSSSCLWLDWATLKDGATIDFEMGVKPNPRWGISAKDAPPSFRVIGE